MFYIGFVTGARTDAEGWPHANGEVLLGDHGERFQSDLRFWDMPRYEAQWRAGIARLLAGSETSALVTSYRGPDAASHLVWPMWREGQTVHVQEQPLRTDGLTRPFDPDAAHEQVQPRRTVGESGEPIPEWQLPLRDLAAFVLE